MVEGARANGIDLSRSNDEYARAGTFSFCAFRVENLRKRVEESERRDREGKRKQKGMAPLFVEA